MKKILALLSIFLLISASFFGCAPKDPYKGFDETFDLYKNTDSYSVDQSVQIKDGDGTTTEITASGTVKKDKGAHLLVRVLYGDNSDYTKFTDVYYIKPSNMLYIDMNEINDFLTKNNKTSYLGISKDVLKPLDNKKYAQISLNDENINKVFETAISSLKQNVKKSKSIKEQNEGYDILLTSGNAVKFFKNIINDIKEQAVSKDIYEDMLDKLDDVDPKDFSIDVFSKKYTQSIKIITDEKAITITSIMNKKNVPDLTFPISNDNSTNIKINDLFSFSFVESKNGVLQNSNKKNTDTYVKTEVSKISSENSNFIGDVEKNILSIGYDKISEVKALSKTTLYASKEPKSNNIQYINDEIKVDIINDKITDFTMTNSYSISDFENYKNYLIDSTKKDAEKALGHKYLLSKMNIDQLENRAWEESDNDFYYRYNYNIGSNIITLTLEADHR